MRCAVASLSCSTCYVFQFWQIALLLICSTSVQFFHILHRHSFERL